MLPIPGRMEDELRRGVVRGDFPGIGSASQVFAEWGRYSDRVIRAESGRVMVACTTEMPGVTPQMIDWWFGWHMPESESVFWLGDLNLRWPVICAVIKPELNTAAVRKFLVTDRMATDLLRHCAEEMNHLPGFLPALYEEMGERGGG